MLQARSASTGYSAGIAVESAWVQFFVTLVFGIGLPTVTAHFLTEHVNIFNQNEQNSLTAAVVALASGTYLLVRMVSYPGVNRAATILPVFASTFGLTVAFILLIRTEYSNSTFILAFLGTIAMQFMIASRLADRDERLHYLVPGGRIEQLIPALRNKFSLWLNPNTPLTPNAIVVADLHHDHSLEWERRLAEAVLEGIPVYHYKQVKQSLTGRVEIDHLSENDFGSLLPSFSYARLKRMIDLTAAFLLSPLLVPLFVVTAIAVKLDSPGPVFFTQWRVGFRGHAFKVVKFRTMAHCTGAQDSACRAASMTGQDDPRITRVGRFLRRSRIDELPQVYNIIRGEMSWIGPRPEAMPLSEWYAKEIPFYAYRHIVRPGITGWAQVNQGHVTDLGDINTKLQFDFFYIRNFSYWIDAIVAFRTIGVMISGFGSK